MAALSMAIASEDLTAGGEEEWVVGAVGGAVEGDDREKGHLGCGGGMAAGGRR